MSHDISKTPVPTPHADPIRAAVARLLRRPRQRMLQGLVGAAAASGLLAGVAEAHTDSLGFLLSNGSGAGLYNIQIFYGSWHSAGAGTPEGALDLRDSVGALLSTEPFTMFLGPVANGVLPAGLVAGTNYFFPDTSTPLPGDLTGDPAGHSIYYFQATTFVDLAPGSYGFGYNASSAFTANWEPSDTAINNGSFTITSGGTLGGVGGAPPASNDIDTGAAAYASSNLGTLVNSAFAGGVLQIDQTAPTYGQNFTLDGSGTNRIDASGQQSIFSGVFSDASGDIGGLILQDSGGSGQVTLSGANTYTGGTTVDAGTLVLSGAGTLGANGGSTAVNGGVLELGGTSQTQATLTQTGGTIQHGSLAVQSYVLGGGTLAGDAAVTAGTLYALQAGTVDGSLGGAADATKTTGGMVTLSAVNGYTGTTTISAGTLALVGGGSIAASGRVVDDAVFDIAATSAGATITSLAGSGIVELGGRTLTLGAADDTFAGVIQGSGGLTLLDGTQILTGSSTYGGATLVSGGELRVNGNLAGTAVDVGGGGTLSGTGGIAGGVNIVSGGTLSPGQSPGTLTVGSLTLNAGSTSIFELNQPGVVGGAQNDLVIVGGALQLAGTLDARAAAAGNFRLFDAASVTGDFDAVQLTAPTIAGAHWLVYTNFGPASQPVQVNLGVYGAGQVMQFWDGSDLLGNGAVDGGDGSWSADHTNWTGAPSQAGVNAPSAQSVAVFQATPGTVTVEGAQDFDSLVFNIGGYQLVAGSLGSLRLNGDGVVDVVDGSVRLELPLGDGAQTHFTKQGAGALVLGGANGFSGGTTVSSGTLSGASDSFGTGRILNHATLVLDQATDGALANGVDGAGVLVKQGAGRLTLTGSNTLNGATTVQGGELRVNGSLALSAVTALNGTTLSGTGDIGALALQAGAALQPGDGGIGTLQVGGALQAGAGSTLHVDVASSGAGDALHVGGAVAIEEGAVLNVRKTDLGAYVLGTRYVALSADGGVTGRYQLTGDTRVSPFFDVVDRYGAQNVYLDVMQTRSFTAVATTANQRGAAGGLDGAGVANAPYVALGSLQSETDAVAALSMLGGELHATLQSSMLADSRFVRQAALDHAATGAGTRGWGQAFGSWGRLGGDGNAATAERSIGGLFVGTDGQLSDAMRAGVLGGYSHSSVDVGARSSHAGIEAWHVGAYTGARWQGFGVRAGAALTRHELETRRGVVFPGYAEQLSASYTAQVVQIFGEVGYGFDMRSFGIEPFGSLAAVEVHARSLREAGGGAALAVERDDQSLSVSTLGLRAAGGLGERSPFALEMMLGWRHLASGELPSTRQSFVSGNAFDTAGVPLAKDVAVAELDLTHSPRPGLSFSLGYSGEAGSRVGDHGARAQARWTF